jgi:hypothetical protein
MNKSFELSEIEMDANRSIFENKPQTPRLVSNKRSNPFTDLVNNFKESSRMTPKNMRNTKGEKNISNSISNIPYSPANLIYSPIPTRHYMRDNYTLLRSYNSPIFDREKSPSLVTGLLELVNQKLNVAKKIYEEFDSVVSDNVEEIQKHNRFNIIFSKQKKFYNPIRSDNFDSQNNVQLKEIKDEQFLHKGKRASFFLKKINLFNKKFISDIIESKLHKVKKIKKDKDKEQKLLKREKKRKKKYTTCKCKSTSCLKLYCECFKNNGYCNHNCSCLDCKNNEDHKSERASIINQIETKQSNINFITPPVSLPIPSSKTNLSCNCKKSQCLKKYCDCFSNNQGCGSNCRCSDCLNTYNN